MAENGTENNLVQPGADTPMGDLGAEVAEEEEAATLSGGLARCQAKTVSGKRCRGRAGASGFCLFHEGGREAERAEWRSKGGRVRQAALAPVLGLPELDWSSTEGVLRTTAAIAEALIGGRVDSARARCLAEMTFRMAGLLGEGPGGGLVGLPAEVLEFLAVVGEGLRGRATQIAPLVGFARAAITHGHLYDGLWVGLEVGAMTKEQLDEAVERDRAAAAPAPQLPESCAASPEVGGSPAGGVVVVADPIASPGASGEAVLGDEFQVADPATPVEPEPVLADPAAEEVVVRRRLPGDPPVYPEGAPRHSDNTGSGWKPLTHDGLYDWEGNR